MTFHSPFLEPREERATIAHARGANSGQNGAFPCPQRGPFRVISHKFLFNVLIRAETCRQPLAVHVN